MKNRFNDLISFVSMASALYLLGCGSASIGATSTSSGCATPTTSITHTSGAQPGSAQLILLDTSKYPKALCNDGTPAAYVIRKGVGAAADRWLIALQGGGFCGTQGNCAARAKKNPHLISSTPAMNHPVLFSELRGIQSADASVNPDFFDANQVKILYCSSDAWSGNQAARGAFNAADTTTWNFQGHAIVQAVIADLKDRMGLSSAAEVLFTGQSAGGVGELVNVNDVAALMPSGVRFVASEDGGYSNLVANFDANGSAPDYTGSSPSGNQAELAQGRLLWNGTGDSKCVAKAQSVDDLNNCYRGYILLASGGTISFPMLIVESEMDTAQLGADGVPQAALKSGNLTTQEQGYTQYFAAHMRTELNVANPSVSTFSPDALIHVEQSSNSLFTASRQFPSGAQTDQKVTGSWYQSPCTVQKDIAQ